VTPTLTLHEGTTPAESGPLFVGTWGTDDSVRVADFAGIVTVALLAAQPALGSKAPQPEVPALWARHALIVDLNELPRTYTCDELWYRFKALLLELGALADSVNIMPYDCSTRSPSVEVQFALPAALPATQASVADFEARAQSIRISAGHPLPFAAGDCELVRQIGDVLLPELPVRSVRFQGDCGAAPQRFDLMLEAFERENLGAPPVSQAAKSVRAAAAPAAQRTTSAKISGTAPHP
jgi:hypothetical protein